ncbi:hypothetical protein AMC90_CH02813 [Rhizobium phaseoli]|uniref:hypothetical protein n=1 Tax=Rhizobium phaseoli TaxID=396 RepID=UPI0007E931B4|nr:hypothetical protein [Rhizobium phaseoli]ANL28614.1 hypothetical protein AMC90_CH02813 [Rhizobium phaseoli]ANM04943.1 hypothetical protein AMC78_CH02865 [Rhizobium phaseoli]
MPISQSTKTPNYVDPLETEPHIQIKAVTKPRATWTVRRAHRFELQSEVRREANPVLRAYEVWGKSEWHLGEHARQFELHDVFVVQLRIVDDVLIAEAKVLLNMRARMSLRLGDESELVFPLSSAVDDHLMRRLAAVPMRLGSWAAERLGPIFETRLDHIKSIVKKAEAA